MRFFIYILFILLFTGYHATGQIPSYIKGRVTDLTGKPVSKASIRVLHQSLEATSNDDGLFAIEDLPGRYYELVINAEGYALQYRRVDAAIDTVPLNIVLHPGREALDEVIVNAEKTISRQQELPVSITTLSAKEITDFRIWNLGQLNGVVPALYAADPGDGRYVTSIRGVVSSSYDPAVATYIDGVNQFTLDTYIPDLVDPAAIEVLRGPQSTLYGRNAMGGVILVTSKEPAARLSGFAEASMGNYGWQRYKAGVQVPVIKNRLLLGGAMIYSHRNGYYVNSYNNERYDRQSAYSGNYFLKYLAGRRWTVVLNTKYRLGRNAGAFPLNTTPEAAKEQPFTLSQDAITRMHDNTWNTSLNIRHDGRRVQLVSETGYQSNYRFYEDRIDADFSPVDGISIFNDYGSQWNKTSVATQEFRVNTATPLGDRNINWVAGTYLFYQHTPAKQATVFGRDALLTGAPDTSFRIVNTSSANNYGIAFFGQAGIPLTQRLTVTLGLRYDYQHSAMQVRSDYQQNNGDAFTIQPDSSGEASYKAFSPKAGITYNISKAHTFFATYSRGFRTGGLSQISADPGQLALYPYSPEYSNNFEAGLKSSLFNNKVRFAVAAFYIYVNDIQVPALLLPAAVTVVQNAGKLESRGVEAELSALAGKHVSFRYSFGYTKALYTSLKMPVNGVEADMSGNKQIFTPDVTSALAVQFDHQLNKRRQLSLTVRGEWNYTGQQYFDQANQLTQSPYNLFHTMICIGVPRFDLSLWMRNVTNTTFISYAYTFGAAHLGDPRVYGATLRCLLR